MRSDCGRRVTDPQIWNAAGLGAAAEWKWKSESRGDVLDMEFHLLDVSKKFISARPKMTYNGDANGLSRFVKEGNGAEVIVVVHVIEVVQGRL